MTRRRSRVLHLVAIPHGAGMMSALLAPAFGNDPLTMFVRGLVVALVIGAVWLAIEEA